MPALLEAGFDWVDARDVAEGALKAEANAPRGGRYLLSGRWVPIRDLALMIASITSTPAPRLVVPLGLARLGVPFAGLFHRRGSRPLFTSVTLHALQGNRHVTCDRAARDLGYRPRPIEVTLQDTLDWFQKAGYLRL
jgi:dihydroflavonol-4-reductase